MKHDYKKLLKSVRMCSKFGLIQINNEGEIEYFWLGMKWNEDKYKWAQGCEKEPLCKI